MFVRQASRAPSRPRPRLCPHLRPASAPAPRRPNRRRVSPEFLSTATSWILLPLQSTRERASTLLTSFLFSAGFIYSPFPPSLPPRPPKLAGSVYLVPDDFHQRNLQLILSIRKYLNNDESKFNEFKNYSAQFRQVRRSPSPS